jgi:DNA/RNA-binding protein KIN17
MNSTRWSSLSEFVKHLGREGIVNAKEDEKDGLLIAWRDTSMQATKRREDIRAQEAAEARNGAGEEKMLKRMAQRAREEAEAKVKAAEAKKLEQKSQTPPVDTPGSLQEESQTGETSKEGDENPQAEAAPTKISFGMKAKAFSTTKPGLGQMKSQSIFKRARTENGDDKSAKKVKL